jgi:hypothetical protein
MIIVVVVVAVVYQGQGVLKIFFWGENLFLVFPLCVEKRCEISNCVYLLAQMLTSIFVLPTSGKTCSEYKESKRENKCNI